MPACRTSNSGLPQATTWESQNRAWLNAMTRVIPDSPCDRVKHPVTRDILREVLR
jgi:hypothetical protein